jgi:hypothetical protein
MPASVAVAAASLPMLHPRPPSRLRCGRILVEEHAHLLAVDTELLQPVFEYILAAEMPSPDTAPLLPSEG